MPDLEIDALVFDVLRHSRRRTRRCPRRHPCARPVSRRRRGREQLLRWQRHVDREQRRIVAGARPYVTSDLLDLEAARLVADAVGVGDRRPWRRWPSRVCSSAPWLDTVAGLARLAERFPLIGLSNAGRAALLELNAHAGLRWHQALSAEDARTYKPDPAIYQLAITVSGRPPERLLIVAAHAWDLRAAQDLGLRTAYVARPVGEPPASSDRFDHADGLADLADRLDDGRGHVRRGGRS